MNNLKPIKYYDLKDAIEEDRLFDFIRTYINSPKVRLGIDEINSDECSKEHKSLVSLFLSQYPSMKLEITIDGGREDSYLFVTESGSAYNAMTTKTGKHFIIENKLDLLETMIGTLYRCKKNLLENDPEYLINSDLERREYAAERKRQSRLECPPDLTGDFNTDLEIVAKWSSCFEEFKRVIDGNMLRLDNRDLHRIGRATYSFDADPIGGVSDIVTIYRSLPAGCDIEEGDWVSLSKQYASLHLDNHHDSIVISQEVSANEVYMMGDENEYVFIPSNTWGDCDSLLEYWNNLEQGKPLDYPKLRKRSLEKILEEKQNNLER